MANNSSVPCYPVREAVSNGVLQGDNPIKFALPLLVIQIAAVLLVTRSMALLFKPLRQPRVLAEIICGVLLGPTVLGRSKAYLDALFPKNSLTLIDTVATLGLLFFLFMVGLELDLKEIKKGGKVALIIALSGILLPFIGGVGIARLFHESIAANSKFAPLVVFMGVPLSITAFPVLVRIMAEMKLLSTDLAKMVVPAAAINDVCAWILLAIGVAIAGPSTSPVTPVYVLLWGTGFVLFMLSVVRFLMEKIAHRVNGQETVGEIYVSITLMGVLLAGFSTDAIGIHPLFGAFVFGLIVPKEGQFAQMLIEKVEDFVTTLMLPLFFVSSGLKTNLGSINSAKVVGYLILLVLTASFGKVSGTVLVARSLRLSWRDALALGFLMNTKGLVELIVLNIGKDLGVLNDQTFAILVLMCLILMFFTTPAVMALYKPARAPTLYNTLRKLEGSKKDQLRILACVHGTQNIPALLNVVEACRSTSTTKALKLYALHLIELSERTSSIMTLTKANQLERMSTDSIMVAFEAYGRISKVPVRLLNAVSELGNMHYDVCKIASEKRATIIIMPYNFYKKEDGTIEHMNVGFSAVNQRVMQNAPCSVGVLVDRGPWGTEDLTETTVPHNVAVLFFGGADDREALAFGMRLAEHPNVKLWVFRFVLKQEDAHFIAMDEEIETPSSSAEGEEIKLDKNSLASVKPFSVLENGKEEARPSIFYEERCNGSPKEAVLSISNTSTEFSLFLAGRGGHNTKGWVSSKQGENSELGVVGNALAGLGGQVTASILVIQQHQSTSPTPPIAATIPSTGKQPSLEH